VKARPRGGPQLAHAVPSRPDDDVGRIYAGEHAKERPLGSARAFIEASADAPRLME
jgi:hypothetical protein